MVFNEGFGIEMNDCKSLKISHRVIEHLGRDLITASDVAITELIKNSIDAEAKDIRIHLDEQVDQLLINHEQLLNDLNKELLSFIPEELYREPVCVLEDNGKGMNTEQLENGFLTIGTDIKKGHKEKMFGEKGIGRLAVQRLGRSLLIETASEDESFASLTFIDWERFLDGPTDSKGQITVPYHRINKTTVQYTRLWIFGISLLDFIETPIQMITSQKDYSKIIINRDLHTSINYLLSPFSYNDIDINMYYKDLKLDIEFPAELLELSESKYGFKLSNNNGQLELDFYLDIKPWYIERVHRSIVRSEAFKRLKKAHVFYSDLLQDNIERINNVLHKVYSEETIAALISNYYSRRYKDSILIKKDRETYCSDLAQNTIDQLKKILPISGELYSFKQGIPIGERIIVSSVNENRKKSGKVPLSIDVLRNFLSTNNGVKLYRDNYRIGFLGNKESDWLNLQQYSTKGQQYYRLDPANTVGYVSVHDVSQAYIQEISSRLDISQNDVSLPFKDFINIIFNNLFYELTRSSYSIIRVILEEHGLLTSNLGNEVRKKTATIRKSIEQGKRAEKKIEEVYNLLGQGDDSSIQQPVLSSRSILDMQDDLDWVKAHLEEERKNQQQALQLVLEANEQLKAVEVEAYNNFKLMANGLITETITHELDSVCRTSDLGSMEPHFDNVKKVLLKYKEVGVINNDVRPIQKSYYAVTDKMREVSDLYNFVEKTFIHRGVYDEFENQNIEDLVKDIESNLVEIQKDNIKIECKTGELSWFVPKGVLIHVFYNLITNSLYWIDKRRKYALSDEHYTHSGDDIITIESPEPNVIVVYDTGTGVMKGMEDILFQPLESGKDSNTGRGMGLYIVQQLLRSFSADIWLDSERNQYGNKYKFTIELDMGDN